MPKIYFDEQIAEDYDAASSDMFDPAVLDQAVDFLAEIAGDGAAFELGTGAGRVALPLSRGGVSAHGMTLQER